MHIIYNFLYPQVEEKDYIKKINKLNETKILLQNTVKKLNREIKHYQAMLLLQQRKPKGNQND